MRLLKKSGLAWLLLSCLLTAHLLAHSFYVSVTRVSQSRGDELLQISIRVFSNDLNAALAGFAARQEVPGDSLLVTYLRETFAMDVNGTPMKWHFLKQSIDDDATVCELEIPLVGPVLQLKVHNTLLVDAVEEQINIVRFAIGGERKALNLNKRVPRGEVVFSGGGS